MPERAKPRDGVPAQSVEPRRDRPVLRDGSHASCGGARTRRRPGAASRGRSALRTGPAGVAEAAHRALDEDVLGYTTAAGTPELRARVARHYDEWYSVEVDPDRLMFTVGASGAFVAAFLAAFDVGDRVFVPSPGYPCYRNALEALGCEVVDLPTTLATRFQPTVELLDRVVAAGGPIAGLSSSPSNPTGTMLDIDRMAQITSWCQANGVWFVSDEIYHGLSYGEPAPTALQFDPDAIVINSFSKYFSMTGWRLGWLVMPEDLRESLTRIGQNVTIPRRPLTARCGRCVRLCPLCGESHGCARWSRAAGFDDLARPTAPSTCGPASTI